MNLFVRNLWTRNPVAVVPLALPIVLYGTQRVDTALLFGIGVPIVTLLVHALSWSAERILPRHARIVPVLMIAAAIVTLLELVVALFVGPVPVRSTYMVRAMVVSGMITWPTVASPRGERFADRMATVAGLGAGFLLGFVPLAMVRVGLNRAGFTLSDSLAIGFLLMAAVRIGMNIFRARAHSQGEQR